MQDQIAPLVDEDLLEESLEILYIYTEPDGSHKNVGCGVGKNSMVDIEWDKRTCEMVIHL